MKVERAENDSDTLVVREDDGKLYLINRHKHGTVFLAIIFAYMQENPTRSGL